MVYDYNKLTGRIIEKYGTRGAFAAALGISRESIRKKMRGVSNWKQDEIISICELLDINLADIPVYFFCATVENQKQ